MKRLNRMFKSAILCAVSVALLTSGTPVSGEYKFREFSDDRSRFERYVEEAGKETTAEEWQGIIDSGREEMKASWEQSAEDEVRRYILGGDDESEVRESLEEAKAGWERSFEAEEAMARGAWYLQRENLTSPAIDLQGLKERIISAKGDNSIDTVEKWDEYVGSTLESSDSRWNSDLNAILETARQKGAALDATERAGYEKELAEFESRQRESFSLERDSVLYLGRNAFITEKFTDTDSLRQKSEAESAEAITDNVIQGVKNDISQEEEKILNRSFSGDGSESINFSNMGDNWQEELKKLIETGMSKWNAAREKLYNEMINWKNSAQEAFDNIEAKWRLGLEKLEQARGDWEKKLSEEITGSLEKWEKEDQELSGNIAEARQDFKDYMENLSGQWSDHSQGLIDMAVNGSRVYTEALDNIKWLQEMVTKYKNQPVPAFTNNSPGLAGVLEKEYNLSSRVSVAIDGMIAQYRQYLSDPYLGSWAAQLIEQLNALKNGSKKYDIQAQLLGTDESSPDRYIEKYSITVSVTSPPIDIFGTYVSYPIPLLNFNWDNVVTADSDPAKKSSYYYYKTELERWNNISANFKTIASDAETYMHEKDMLGIDGPGYLNPVEGEDGDPYLMTGAEFNYEVAKRDRDFWEDRLAIAQAVKDYAFPVNGERESAEETEARKSETYAKMDSAKTAYQNALNGTQNIVAELKKIQQAEKPGTPYDPANPTAEWKAYLSSIEYLSGKYREAGEVLKTAEKNLEVARTALILIENSKDASYIQKEIEEIQKNILSSDRDLREKRLEYYNKVSEGERVSITAGYAELYSKTVKERESAAYRFNLIKGIVAGEENDASLSAWGEGLAADSTAKTIWGESSADRSAELLSIVNRFKTASGSEKGEARAALSAYIRSIYNTAETGFNRMDTVLGFLESESFVPRDYLDSAGGAPISLSKEYAGYSLDALNVIKDAMEKTGSGDYNTVSSYLKNLFADSKYVYGGSNGAYMANYAALKIFDERYRGLTPETWGSYISGLEEEIGIMEGIKDLYSGTNYSEFKTKITDYENEAASGEAKAVALLREYYNPGSSIQGFGYIEQFLGKFAKESENRNYEGEFVSSNYNLFRSVQDELNSRDYLTGMLGYINSKLPLSTVGEDITLTADNLRNLTPAQLSLAAEGAQRYVSSLEGSGIPVPAYLYDLTHDLTSFKSALDDGLFISDFMNGRITGTVDEIYENARKSAVISSEAESFIKAAMDFINNGGYGAGETSEQVLIMWSSLSDASKNFIRGNESSEITSISDYIDSLTLSRDKLNISLYADNYVTSGSGMKPAEYAAALGLSGEGAESLVKIIEPVYNRRSYESALAAGGIDSIENYVTSNFTGESAEELKRYALVKNYLSLKTSDGYSGADTAFTAYVSYRKFEDYLKDFINGTPKGDTESESEYLDRIMASWSGGVSYDYRSFASDFINKKISSFAYLPDEVRVYAASEAYYNSIFKNGKVLDKSGIETFLEGRFGSDAVTGDLVDSVYSYAMNLNTIRGYYGQEGYAERLDSENREFFEMYRYGGDTVLLPGLEYGIYGSRQYTLALAQAASGETGEALDRFITAAEKGMAGVSLAARLDSNRLRSAESLRTFYAGGEGGDNWRDYIVPGVTGEDTVVYTSFDSQSSWYDIISTDTGMRSSIIYSEWKLEKEGRKFSENRVISDANALYDLFNSFFKGAGGSAGAENRGISGFLNEAAGYYERGNSYSPGADGVFGFEAGLTDLVSSYRTLSSDYAAGIEELTSVIAGMENTIQEARGSLKCKKGSYDLLLGSGKEKLYADFDAARLAHEKAKSDFEKLGEDLAGAQDKFNTTNNQYIDHMSSLSVLYKTYKDYEFEYEKAYAVWEYGNTPYLKGDAVNDSGVSTGELPGNGGINVDLNEIPVPDANDNYNRVKAKYDEAMKIFTDAETKKNNQETVADLNSDSEYKGLKDSLVESSESYIRSAQVDAEIKEKVESYKLKYEEAQKSFDAYKDSLIFFSQGVTLANGDAAKIAELEKARDLIMSHVKSTADMNNLIQALKWYSCKLQVDQGKYIPNPPRYVMECVGKEKTSCRMVKDRNWLYDGSYACQIIQGEAAAFNNLSQQMKDDVILLAGKFGNTNSVKTVLDNYHLRQYSDYKHHYLSTGVRRGSHSEDHDERMMWAADAALEPPLYSLNDTISDFVTAKTALVTAEKNYRDVSSVKYIADIKKYIGPDSDYKLTDEDLAKIYDSTMPGYTPPAGGIKIDYLRKEERRKDLDGDGMQARVVNGEIEVLLKDGTVTARYSVTDPGVRLKKGNTIVTGFENGELYDFYDMNYNIADVTGALKGSVKTLKDENYYELMTYVRNSVGNKTHDYTIILRDLEGAYHGLQETAVAFNSANEKKQRGYDGYGEITRQYVNNGAGESIQGLIFAELKKQSEQFQEQQWQQQQEKFEQRKERWMEVTGYIYARGDREWNLMTSDFISQWRKWRFEAKQEISTGLEWWDKTDLDMKGEMNRWTEETGNASSKAAAEKMYQELASKISGYEEAIKKKGGVSFEIDTDLILSKTMKNLPIDTIGILSQSMTAADTTAGYTQMLNLGLGNSLFKYNQEQMENYQNALGVLQNMRVIDIFNGIIDNFNSQLEEANESSYRGIKYNIANADPYLYAPFKRSESEKQWSIEVCVESNLTGNKYKTRRFADYSYMLNKTVFLQPIKGIGGTIDFNNANTYLRLDKSELDVYVGLEQDALTNKIDEVFKEDGLFSTHQKDEYTRIGDAFGEYYGDWMAGEALKEGAFYSKPMFPKGPNMLQTAAIAASLTGQPWAAILVAAATSGIQMADGTMTWKQAAFQVGMSAAAAGIGAGAGQLGGMAGATGSFANIATTAAVSTVGNTVLSGVTLEGGKLGYDTKRMTSAKTWTSAGISMAASIVGQQYCTNDFSKALVSGVGSGLSQGVTTGDWKESMKTGVATSVGNYLGGKLNGAVSGVIGRDSFAVDNFLKMGMRQMLGSGEKFSWDTVAKNDALDNLVSDYVTGFLSGPPVDMAAKRKEEMKELGFSEEEADSILENEMGLAAKQQRDYDKLGFLDKLETSVGGVFLSMKNDFSKTLQDAGNAATEIASGAGKLFDTIGSYAKSAWDGVTSFASSAINAVGNFAGRVWSGVTDVAQSVKNKVSYGVYGTNDDPEVQRAIIAHTPVIPTLLPVLGYEPENPDGENGTVTSRFKKGTNMDNYAAKIAKFYSTSDNPISQEKAMENLCKANGNCTPEELQEKINKGEPIKEPADMCWNKDIQKTYVPRTDALNNNSGVSGAWDQLRNYPSRIAGIFANAGNLDNDSSEWAKEQKKNYEYYQNNQNDLDIGFPLGSEANITSGYGMRIDPRYGDKRFHDGIDFGVPEGTEVLAAADGKVVYADKNGAYGNYIEIEHANGFHTFYGHLKNYNVKVGDPVRKGGLIASSGNTGSGTGAHLHYGWKYNGSSTRPRL